MSKIIELKNVNKWFDKFQALKDVSLEVNQQEKIVICGPSGSGKSTLIRCINRLEEHQDGKIIVDGNEISENTKDIASDTRMEVAKIINPIIPSGAIRLKDSNRPQRTLKNNVVLNGKGLLKLIN